MQGSTSLDYAWFHDWVCSSWCSLERVLVCERLRGIYRYKRGRCVASQVEMLWRASTKYVQILKQGYNTLEAVIFHLQDPVKVQLALEFNGNYAGHGNISGGPITVRSTHMLMVVSGNAKAGCADGSHSAPCPITGNKWKKVTLKHEEEINSNEITSQLHLDRGSDSNVLTGSKLRVSGYSAISEGRQLQE
nr:hypothetical protein Iba_chr13eCG2380 [Ipomoea batatas]